MDLQLRDRVIVITGGTSGIGAATALALAREGACPVMMGLDALPLELSDDLQQAGVRFSHHTVDLRDHERVATIVDSIVTEYGRIDGLVNNAGVLDVPARVDTTSWERLERMMRINVIGAMFCAREAILRMSTKHGGKGGSIVNLSSVAARVGAPGQYVDYAASKGAIDTFNLGLAKEVAAEGIRVNAVRPGLIDTEIHAAAGDADRASKAKDFVPMKRAGRAEEVAQAIAWLVSDASSYSTGAVVDVSGGV